MSAIRRRRGVAKRRGVKRLGVATLIARSHQRTNLKTPGMSASLLVVSCDEIIGGVAANLTILSKIRHRKLKASGENVAVWRRGSLCVCLLFSA